MYSKNQQLKLIRDWYAAKAKADAAKAAAEAASAALMAAMDSENAKKWDCGGYTVTRVADSMTTSYDYKALDNDYPGLRDKYSVKKPKAGYLKK